MRFIYNNNEYELMELTEPNKSETFDIIAIFKVKYCIWDKNDFVEVNKTTYNNSDDRMEKYDFINYFYGSDEDNEVLIEQAKEYINGGSN